MWFCRKTGTQTMEHCGKWREREICVCHVERSDEELVKRPGGTAGGWTGQHTQDSCTDPKASGFTLHGMETLGRLETASDIVRFAYNLWGYLLGLRLESQKTVRKPLMQNKQETRIWTRVVRGRDGEERWMWEIFSPCWLMWVWVPVEERGGWRFSQLKYPGMQEEG